MIRRGTLKLLLGGDWRGNRLGTKELRIWIMFDWQSDRVRTTIPLGGDYLRDCRIYQALGLIANSCVDYTASTYLGPNAMPYHGLICLGSWNLMPTFRRLRGYSRATDSPVDLPSGILPALQIQSSTNARCQSRVEGHPGRYLIVEAGSEAIGSNHPIICNHRL